MDTKNPATDYRFIAKHAQIFPGAPENKKGEFPVRDAATRSPHRRGKYRKGIFAMKSVYKLAALFLFFGAVRSFAATYYISPTGSDSASGTSASPFKTLSKAMSVGAGGDTYVYKNGTYNYSGSELNSVIKSGSAGAYTIIKAESDGGAVITVTNGLSMPHTGLKSYVQIEGFKFTGAYEKEIHGYHLRILRCAFKGGPSDGNSVSVLVGSNDYSPVANDILIEDCWFYGSGGRYNLLVFNSENVILRRVVGRHEGGWNDGASNPEAVFTSYNSSNVRIQNAFAIDSTNGTFYTFDGYGAFYVLHNGSANPDHPVFNTAIRGSAVVETYSHCYSFELPDSSGDNNVATDIACVNPRGVGISYGGSNDNVYHTLNRVGIIRRNPLVAQQSGQAGIGYWGDGGNITVTNAIVTGMTGSDFSGVSPTYFNTYGNGSNTGSGTGRQSYNPLTNGWLYPLRVESGSNLANQGSGGQIGPNISTKWGADGSMWGQSGYDSDTGAPLWPFPNEARIKSDLCENANWGLCAGSDKLTEYLFKKFGNPVPPEIYGGADTTNPTISITAPANNATISGNTALTASASDNVGVAGVQFRVDGSNVGGEDTSSPYSYTLDSTAYPNGSHTVSAVARDAAGNTNTASVTVTVSNPVPDTTAPNASVTAPANNATVSGNITLTASASDNVGVAGVQFRVDGTNFGTEDNSSPYSKVWSSTSVANGSHVISIVARDAAGNTDTASVTVTVNNAVADTTPPTVSMTAPANNATVSGTAVQASASASDNVGVAGVQFYLGSNPMGAEDTSAPYSYSWNSTAVPNGSYTVSAVARDDAGNTNTSSVNITISNAVADTTPPNASITAPANNATVSGNRTLTASATDNVGVVGVQFMVDGTNVGTEDTSSPYSRSWNTTAVSNGSHVISIVARDAAGNTDTASINVTVDNMVADTTPPSVSLTAPANNATVSGTAVTASASASDNVGVTGVQFYLDDNPMGAEDTAAPYSYSWDSTVVPNGSYTVSAVARDDAGNTSTSSVDITINNADTTAPNASVTSPVNGATVAGNITMTASATDNVGVAGVQFRVDGANVGTEDTTSPFSRVWNSTSVANGSHVISIVARDAAGNTDTASVTVTVNNTVADTTPPTVSINSPANNANLAGSFSVTASASDNVGVVGVQFKVDGVNISSEDTSSPYSRSWNSNNATNGSHVISAVARDAAGNTRTASVTITVNNVDTVPPTAPAAVNMQAESSTTCRVEWTPATDNKGVSGYLLVLAYDSQFVNRVPGFDGVNLGNVTSAMLTNLDPATVYYARIYAFDSGPNLSAPSAPASVATMMPPPPLVSKTNSVPVTANKVTLTWDTSSPARCIVQYGLTTDYGQTTTLEPSYDTSHSVTLSDLAFKMLYHVRILSLDAMGQTTVSNDMTLQTPLIAPEPGELVSSRFITPNSPGGANASAVFDASVKHVSIFDMRGHQVFDAESSGQAIVWTARDGSGRALESGAYLARLTDATNKIRTQVIVIAK